MRKSQKITLVCTLSVIVLMYLYYFILNWSYTHYFWGFGCADLPMLANTVNLPGYIPGYSAYSSFSAFLNTFMHCGLLDIYAIVATIIQAITHLPYIFIIEVLPWILWLPIALIGTTFYYHFEKK